ncbi:hypothetical protein FCM35_KLT13307 [Carex littledalei]|uniref:Uncharacterized protein n=1 Tax=Carex littledalei TaxID=544730 RepID=A0A833V102_9POAL|nr:hypothetical protein FCM35_KLT13307 [Carex littledalei]
MADDEKQTEVMRSGTDWEVVSLTSSAYAAAPNKSEIMSDASKINSNQESSLFGSGHFVFPPSEHENLPVDPNEIDIKTREQENLSGEEEEGQIEKEKREEELETAGQDESFKKEESQEISSEVENREDKFELGADKKREGKEGEDGLEWVKKRGLWLYQHVKEANAVWSVVVAAALVGIVILGQRWQREKSQHQYQIK